MAAERLGQKVLRKLDDSGRLGTAIARRGGAREPPFEAIKTTLLAACLDWAYPYESVNRNSDFTMTTAAADKPEIETQSRSREVLLNQY